jgi:hypothetical protein
MSLYDWKKLWTKVLLMLQNFTQPKAGLVGSRIGLNCKVLD